MSRLLCKYLNVQLHLVIMAQDKNYVYVDFQPSRVWLMLKVKDYKLYVFLYNLLYIWN